MEIEKAVEILEKEKKLNLTVLTGANLEDAYFSKEYTLVRAIEIVLSELEKYQTLENKLKEIKETESSKYLMLSGTAKAYVKGKLDTAVSLLELVEGEKECLK